jgi:pimeloyl-ACP methyl ester carboxylesterase
VLVFLPGITAHHEVPVGMDRRFQLAQLRPLARRREVWWLNRPHGLTSGVSMADIAADHAVALRELFGRPVDVLGVSTGGSVALQLAADAPSAVRKLVLVSAAYALGERGRRAQRDTAMWLRAGRTRRAAVSMMDIMGAGPLSHGAAKAMGWLLGGTFVGRGDPDLLALIEAEDAFDLHDRLHAITAPTLVIGGARDACYGRALLERTAAAIPDARLVLFPHKGHLGISPSVARPVLDFLDEP